MTLGHGTGRRLDSVPAGPGGRGLGDRAAASAAGLALGVLLDRALGDPHRYHPVAGFGQVAAALERRVHRDSRAVGVAYAVGLVGGTAALGLAISRLTRPRSAELLVTAAATWAVLGARSLEREAAAVGGLLEAGDLDAARLRIPSLVGRDPAGLGTDELSRAVVESVAENTSDAVVAPLVWGAVAGLPGLLAYRAANTLDAMVGHRTERHLRFGWAAARLDDVANWVPARVTAVLAIGLGGDPSAARRAVHRDARHHPSPNAGVVEAAFAGSLGVRLGGRNTYGGRVEDRGALGDGRPVRPTDIAAANRLAGRVGLVAAALAVLVRLLRARPIGGAAGSGGKGEEWARR